MTVGIAVMGRQNSGKTYWVERIVARWRAQGLRAAVLKHDGHADGPGAQVLRLWQKAGSDTDRAVSAGAAAAAVFGGGAMMLMWPEADEAVEAAAQRLLKVLCAGGERIDAVILEGGKSTMWPKLVALRTLDDAVWLRNGLAGGVLRNVWGVLCGDGLSKGEAARCLAGLVPRVYDEHDVAELCEKLRTDPHLRLGTGVWTQ